MYQPAYCNNQMSGPFSQMSASVVPLRIAKKTFRIAISDECCDITRQLVQPATNTLHPGNQVIPARGDPRVSTHHKAVWVLQKDRLPGGIEPAARRDIKAHRKFHPEVRRLLQEPSYCGRWRRHSGMGPQDAHLRVQVQELCDGDIVHVSVEKKLLLRRQLSETAYCWRIHLRCRQVKFANPLVDATLQPFLHVGLHRRVTGPTPHILLCTVGAQERDNTLRGCSIELQCAVVRRAGD